MNWRQKIRQSDIWRGRRFRHIRYLKVAFKRNLEKGIVFTGDSYLYGKSQEVDPNFKPWPVKIWEAT